MSEAIDRFFFSFAQKPKNLIPPSGQTHPVLAVRDLLDSFTARHLTHEGMDFGLTRNHE